MPTAIPLLLALPLAWGANVRVVDAAQSTELARQLGLLSAPSATERSAAARWLSGHLTSSDLAAVRNALAGGDAEVGRWIAFALGERDAHLGLAVALARDPDSTLQAIGREAIDELALRWSPGRDRAPKIGKELLDDLEHVAASPVSVGLRGSLTTIVDRIVRLAWDGPRIVVDPRLGGESASARDVERTGAPLHLLIDLAEVRGARLEGFGAVDDENAAPRWLCVAPKTATNDSGSIRLTGWLLDAADVERPERRAPAAVALAESGWPAAIAWFEERAVRDHDEVAFDALCIAAGRGQTARCLVRPEIRVDLVARMSKELARENAVGDARAESIARALGAAGSSGPNGEDLVAPLLDGAASLAPRELWSRLVAVEGARSASPVVRRSLIGLLAARREPPIVLQTLRALATMDRPVPSEESGEREPNGGDAPIVTDAAALSAWCRTREATSELFRAVRASGAKPAGGMRAAFGDAATIRDLRVVVDACEWSLAIHDDTYASECVRALAQRGDALIVEEAAARLAAHVRAGFGPRIGALVEAARASADSSSDGAKLDALAVLAGCASDEAKGRALARTTGNEALGRLELACLGELAASARGNEARKALIARLPAARGADARDLLAALTRATDALLAARAEPELREFVAAVRGNAREAAPAVRAGLRVDQWPAPPKRAPRRLDALDRRLSELAGG